MTCTPPWQEATIRDLAPLLQPDDDVRALVLCGSAIPSRRDRDLDAWSDIDIMLVVAEGALDRFHPSLDWLRPLGEIYAYAQSATAFSRTTRVCFREGRRLDLLVTTEAALARVAEWPFVPFWSGTETVFSRSAAVDRALTATYQRPAPPLISADQFAAMANDFWFKATLALTKVVRDDLLIALHLALDLVRDCCVLGMFLRDRARGTAHHRTGGIGNEIVARLKATRQPYTAAGILDSLEGSAVAFDRLAGQWDAAYRERRGPLLAWIGAARRTVSSGHGGRTENPPVL